MIYDYDYELSSSRFVKAASQWAEILISLTQVDRALPIRSIFCRH